MIKAIIFDWGEVITTHTFRDKIEYCAEKLSVETDALTPVIYDHWDAFQEGKLEEKDMWESIGNILNVKAPEVDSLWGEATRAKYTENPKMIELLKTLRKSGYKTALLSNTEHTVVKIYEERKELNSLFDTKVFSCIENVAKPNKEIYELTLERLGVKPDEAVFIDDNFDNVKGAQNAGLYAIHFKGYESLVEELNAIDVGTEYHSVQK